MTTIRAIMHCCLVMLFASSVLAQTEASGTIEGSLGGEERSWYTIRLETEAESANTAEWMHFMGDYYQFSLQGHPELRFSVEGTLSLEFSFFSLPASCPCTPDEAIILYFSTSNIMSDLYEAEDASITITELERVDGELIRLVGEFSATLLFRADIRSELDAGDSLDVSGSFEVLASRFDLDF